jgi:hypothetical protein
VLPCRPVWPRVGEVDRDRTRLPRVAHGVASRPAVEHVVVGLAIGCGLRIRLAEEIVAATAVEHVVAGFADEEVVTVAGGEDVVARSAVQVRGVAVRLHDIVAGASLPVHEALAAHQRVVARPASDELHGGVEAVVALAEIDQRCRDVPRGRYRRPS